MNYRNYLFAGIFIATGLMACNSGKKKQGDQDTAKASVPVPHEDRTSFQQDTVIGDFHITAITRGDATMRNLIIAVNAVKDSTAKADTIMDRDIKGKMKHITVGDLDHDKMPELYCFTTSCGTDAYGKVYAYVINKEGAIRINTMELDTLEEPAYKGRDSFYIKGNTLVRTFPLFREGQANAVTSNDRKTISYGLQKKNNTYVLTKTDQD
ncbi:hypothetical protein [Chitinophaga sp. MM2321]|uniref:hypothetical protein n=1 Tax=Chitinophaga sp. MM2321 TaxID=3137178 RepID=UPI0032D59AD3